MKNILLTFLAIISVTLFSCSSNSNATEDFSSPEDAAISYFNVLKNMEKDSVKNIMLTYEEFLELKNTKEGFAQGLSKLGNTDSAQYKGVIDETMMTYNRAFATSAGDFFLTKEKMSKAEYKEAEIEENDFNGLELVRMMINFKAEGGTTDNYAVRVTAVNVSGNWKAVDFGAISLGK